MTTENNTWSARTPLIVGVFALIALVGGFGTWSVFTEISGAVIAGVLSWFVVRGLARTGALSRFESGRAFARSAT